MAIFDDARPHASRSGGSVRVYALLRRLDKAPERILVPPQGLVIPEEVYAVALQAMNAKGPTSLQLNCYVGERLSMKEARARARVEARLTGEATLRDILNAAAIEAAANEAKRVTVLWRENHKDGRPSIATWVGSRTPTILRPGDRIFPVMACQLNP